MSYYRPGDVSDLDDLCRRPEEIKATLESLLHEMQHGVFSDMEWAADLARHLHDTLHDGDPFCAIAVRETDPETAVDILTKMVPKARAA